MFLTKNSFNLYYVIATACDKFNEWLWFEVSIVNKKSANLKSSFDNPEFSGPKSIADFLFNWINLLRVLNWLIHFFSKNLFLLVVATIKLKFEIASDIES